MIIKTYAVLCIYISDRCVYRCDPKHNVSIVSQTNIVGNNLGHFRNLSEVRP